LKRRFSPLFVAIAFVAAPGVAGAADDLSRARTLDQEGVRLYREGHYREAIAQFKEARDAGGPASELWNIARCHGKLGENREEAQTIEKYLAEPGLSKEDRAEAQTELTRLQKLHSPVVITSEPSGARVKIDGSVYGDTPLQTRVAPGPHRVSVDHGRWDGPVEKDVDASYGEKIEWSAQGRMRAANEKPREIEGAIEPDYLSEPSTAIGLIPSIGVGMLYAQYGGVGGSVHAQANVRALYMVWQQSAWRVLVGGRVMVTGDAWRNTVGAPIYIQGCGAPLSNEQDATSWFALATGAIERSIWDKLRVGAELGIGATFFNASQVGGDLFTPSCNPGLKAEPSFLLGLDASYNVTKRLRVEASPLLLSFTPSFPDTSTQPKDASGIWFRIGAELGLAFEL
jgi:hypothetical protein